MRYTQPHVLGTVDATVAIQSGMGRTAHGLPKDNSNVDNPHGSAPSLHISTTSAYEADE
jgi:hypothetical protein